jgi:uncharacterized protein YdcH (DUF465 family)
MVNNTLDKEKGGAFKKFFGKKMRIMLFFILFVCIFSFIAYKINFSYDGLFSNINRIFQKINQLNDKEEPNLISEQNIFHEVESENDPLYIIEDLRYEISQIGDSLKSREYEFTQLKKDILQLKSNINDFIINANRNEVIRIVLNIQNDFKNFKNYFDELQVLKSLPLNENIKQNILILEENENLDLTEEEILNQFNIELINFLDENNVFKKNDNKLVNFLSKYIVIVDKKNNDLNSPITDLEKNINNGSYKKAYLILNEYENLSLFFPKTKSFLETINKTNDALINIISLLTKEYND